MHEDGIQLHSMASEANGEFAFMEIPAGSYLVIVNAKGFAPFTSAEFAIALRQAYQVPGVLLSVATANLEVTVRPTEMIAAGQIRAEESSALSASSQISIQVIFTTPPRSLRSRNSRSLHMPPSIR
jgi:hypothetical protein